MSGKTLRQRFFEWLYTPTFLNELYKSEELPPAGSTVFIMCCDASEPLYWDCVVHTYDDEYKILVRQHVTIKMYKTHCPVIRMFYNREGKRKGAKIIWMELGDACNEVRQLPERETQRGVCSY